MRQLSRDKVLFLLLGGYLILLLLFDALIAYFKALTNVACPRDLQLLGGKEPYFHLLSLRPNYLPYHQCFPAGHASVGYA